MLRGQNDTNGMKRLLTIAILLTIGTIHAQEARWPLLDSLKAQIDRECPVMDNIDCHWLQFKYMSYRDASPRIVTISKAIPNGKGGVTWATIEKRIPPDLSQDAWVCYLKSVGWTNCR